MAEELTVLVKKADGAFERRPLSALIKRAVPPAAAARPPKPAPAAVAPAASPPAVKRGGALPPALLPAPPEEKLIASVPTPKRIIAPVATPSQEEEPPLLEEAEPEGVGPRASPGREQTVSAVIKTLSFTVPGNAANRLRSAIQLYLKDVRNEEQTLAILIRPVKQGGVGLEPGQAREALAQCGEMRLQELRSPAPVVGIPPLVPAAPGRHPSRFSPPSPAPPPPLPPAGSLAGSPGAAPPVFRFKSQERPVLTDIVAPKVTVGPVEELGALTATDFRRLSRNPAEAAGVIGKKFQRLRAESILLWLSGREAWRASPLYRGYLAAAATALNQRRKLAEVAAADDKLSGAEVVALAEMARQEGL